ncbi:pilus assembly protein PilM [Microbacterium sp. No. 7]|uniref:pilus assembly protein PilM n=1 Tax=Microbacterium sp. No. 7 TaxID=1714373 RepID=UPI0006D266D0|nr:pilus assembly protein PilM [Microbacterium sp. No. 7]
MAKSAIGLEITQTAVRAAEVTLGDRPALVKHGQVELPVGAAHDSEVIDAGVVADALRELWGKAGFSSRRVVLGINSWRVLVREFSTELTHPELIAESLPYEVGELLPVSPDQAALDFVATEVTDEGTTGLLVAANAPSVDALLGALSAARLHAQSVDLLPFGLVRLAGRLTPDDTVLMVHVGGNTTAITLVSHGVPIFVRMLPATIALTAPQSAEAPEQTGGRLDRRRESQRADVEREQRDAAEDLGARLRSTLQYYGARGLPPITGALLSGAGATNAITEAALRDALDIPVQPLDPMWAVRLRGKARTVDPVLLQQLIGPISLTIGADA